MVSGMTGFRKFLGKHRAELCATPALLIEGPVDSEITSKGTSSELFQHVLHCFNASGLRTSTAHHPSAHFPLKTDISSALEFARRTGTGTIVGVGGSGAIELAKAVSQDSVDFENLILVPEDYGSLLNASASHALLLDLDEEGLFPYPSKERKRNDVQSHIVLSDIASPSRNDPDRLQAACYAGLVLALDKLHREMENGVEVMSLIKKASDLIDKASKNEGLQSETKQLQDLMVRSGESISFGISNDFDETRSVPLALSSSLLAKFFPGYDFVGFIACLLPGVLSILEGTKHNELAMELSSRYLYRCPQISKHSGDHLELQTLLSQVQTNMALWDCVDAEDEVLKHVLRKSLDL